VPLLAASSPRSSAAAPLRPKTGERWHPPAELPLPRTPDHAARFRSTRAAHQGETAEDYVEAVTQLIETTGEARIRDLALMMGVSHVTVTRIVARLAREGLLGATPYRPVRLTPAGRRLAARTRERHQIVLAFLRSLGVPPRQAEIDAEGIEHHVSDATIRAMKRAIASAPVPPAAVPASPKGYA
jgi:DtxR family manganese transport transcriptional regulator